MKYLRFFAIVLILSGIGIFLTGWGSCNDVKSLGCPKESLLSYAVVGGLVLFLLGIALLAISFIWKKVQESEDPFLLTKPELYACRFIGAAMFISGFPGVMWALLLAPLSLIYGVYLLRVKKHHLFINLIFAGAFFLTYWFTTPLFGPAATYFKMFFIVSDWNDVFSWMMSFSFLTKAVLFGSALALLVSDVLILISPFRRLARKGLMSNSILLIVVIGLFVGPLFRPINPGYGNPPSSWGSSGCPPIWETIKYDPLNVSASRDNKNNWIYQIKAQTYAKEDAEIIRITGQKPKNFLFSRKEIIGPPFGDNVAISIGEKTEEKIIIPANKDFVLKIFSAEPIYSLVITSKNNCQNSFGFLVFDRLQAPLTIEEEKIDPNLRIVLSAAFPPGEDMTGKTKFKSGEAFHPNEIGLPKDTHYGFQITNEAGQQISVVFDKTMTGKGMEGGGVFNTEADPLAAGKYTIQLVEVIGDKMYVVSKKDFEVYD